MRPLTRNKQSIYACAAPLFTTKLYLRTIVLALVGWQAPIARRTYGCIQSSTQHLQLQAPPLTRARARAHVLASPKGSPPAVRRAESPRHALTPTVRIR